MGGFLTFLKIIGAGAARCGYGCFLFELGTAVYVVFCFVIPVIAFGLICVFLLYYRVCSFCSGRHKLKFNECRTCYQKTKRFLFFPFFSGIIIALFPDFTFLIRAILVTWITSKRFHIILKQVRARIFRELPSSNDISFTQECVKKFVKKDELLEISFLSFIVAIECIGDKNELYDNYFFYMQSIMWLAIIEGIIHHICRYIVTQRSNISEIIGVDNSSSNNEQKNNHLIPDESNNVTINTGDDRNNNENIEEKKVFKLLEV